MFSLLPPQEGTLVGVKNTALKNTLFLVQACIRKPDSILKLALQTDLTTVLCAVPITKASRVYSCWGWLCQPADLYSWSFVSSSLRYRVPNSGLSLCYRQVLPVTFCKKTWPFLLYSLRDSTSALFWPSTGEHH